MDDVLPRLAARSQAVRGLRGFATIEVYADGDRVKLQQVVLAERPGRLRVETLSPFDQPISYLATDGQLLTLYLLGEARYLTGPATADNVARLFPLRLEPARLVDALLGGVPVPKGPRRLDWDASAGRYRLTAGEGDRTVVTVLRPEDLLPERIAGRDAGDGQAWSLELHRYREEGGHLLPGRVRFRMGSADVTFRWDERELNPELPAEAWRIEPPPGVLVEELPGQAGPP